MKSIIITGATSGIGFECARQLARIAPHEQIIIACRNLRSGNEIADKIRKETGHRHLRCMLLDLESMQSIRDFRDNFAREQEAEITALINNAGIQIVTETQYTKEGFESTFGVNHVAPFYLTLLLLPFMNKNGSITFTASGVHDPKQKTGIVPPVFGDAKEMAYPVKTDEKLTIIGQRRYSTTKLHNILTVYKLQEKLAHTNIRVNAFDPGMVPGTGLARTYSPVLRLVWKYIFPVFRLFKHNVNTAPVSGRRLAELACSEQYRHYRGKYFEGAREIKSSDDSYNKQYQDVLWTSTLALLKIRENEIVVSI